MWSPRGDTPSLDDRSPISITSRAGLQIGQRWGLLAGLSADGRHAGCSGVRAGSGAWKGGGRRGYDRQVKVELLYFDGCPSYEALRPRVERMLAERGLDGLDLVPIRSVEEAEAQRFLGSPTLRVDGHDVEPGAAERTDFGMKCRIYATGDGLRPTPADVAIAAALDAVR
jgi:hypothetical protein